MCVCVHVYMCVQCEHECMWVRVYVCMSVCVYVVKKCVHVNVHLRTYRITGNVGVV